MMEVYRTPSKDVRKIILANVTYKEVIDGLNGYFASEPRNDYITVKMETDKQNFALYEAEAWADILISWLRTEHGIFYYPGMEAKHAKIERIPPLTERLMDEGALKSLKDLHKRVTGDEAGTNSHTLIADSIKYAVNAKEREIKKLKDRIAELESSCAELNTKLATRWTKTSLINWLQQRARHKGVELDDAFLYSDDTQYDWQDIIDSLFDEIVKMRGEIGAKESGIEDLKEHITLLEADLKKRTAEIKKVNDQRWKDLRDIYRALGRYDTCDNDTIDGFAKAVEARAEYIESISRNAERETRKAVNEQLKKDTDYVADTLYDILEALGISKSCTVYSFDISELKTRAIRRASLIKSEHDRYLEQLEKAAADYQALDEEYQKLKSAEKSDVNALIRNCCTKHGIIAPSRYFSDEACIEYLFSVIEQKDRSFAILQDLYRDVFKKQPVKVCCDDLSAEDIATKILDRMLTTEDLLHKSVDSVNKECKATGRMMVKAYKIDLKDYILKDIKEHGYRYDGLETKSVEEIVDWIIEMATCPRNEWTDHEIRNLRGQIDRLKGLINAMNEEVKDM